MKACVITVLFLLLFRPCSAPFPSREMKDIQKKQFIEIIRIQEYEKEIGRFAEHLRLKESPDWTVINPIGAMGWFQFMPATLRHLGYGHITPAAFKKDHDIFPPELQVKLLIALIKCNEISLQNYFSFEGEIFNGILITRSGILAGAHLGGAEGVKIYLTTRGKVNFKDQNNKSIGDYIKEFQGYKI